jgi:hypothetical protein
MGVGVGFVVSPIAKFGLPIQNFDSAPLMSLLNRLSVTATRMSTVPALTPLVTKAMHKLYPLALADRSWDNVGLLLEPPVPRKQIGDHLPAVMLTIDLTTAVAKEALEDHTHVETIVSYRMRPLGYVVDTC